MNVFKMENPIRIKTEKLYCKQTKKKKKNAIKQKKQQIYFKKKKKKKKKKTNNGFFFFLASNRKFIVESRYLRRFRFHAVSIFPNRRNKMTVLALKNILHRYDVLAGDFLQVADPARHHTKSPQGSDGLRYFGEAAEGVFGLMRVQ